MEDTASQSGKARHDTPLSLIRRADHPKRLIQATRAMHNLETDLRTLLEKVPYSDIAKMSVDYAITSYNALRTVTLDSLDAESRAEACDEAIGLPVIEDDATFPAVLLKLSQATRYIGVEEAWPGLVVASKVQDLQVADHLKTLESATSAQQLPDPKELTNGSGYI